MNQRISEVLENRGGNYILPFFWQHGEKEEVLREEMARIHGSAIGAVCVESRPHPEFCGPRWWRDMDIIMDEARRRGMRVWLLDDAHFPTGFANGWIRDKFPALKKIYLAERHMDVVGPEAGASILMERWVSADEQLLAVVAVPYTPEGGLRDAMPLDLTGHCAAGRLQWDVPAGHWRVFIIVQTPRGGGAADYLNPIDAVSARVLIDAVYEPHHARYAADFGKTFAGFFSDEPNIGNGAGWYDCAIGRKAMVLPWRAGLKQELDREFGGDTALHLPGLWHNTGPSASSIRYAYMNLVSHLYGQCFTDQISKWCIERGVEYIGHIIEDNDAHTRLGASAAHFFRSMGGQTMSGIDVVLWQIRPGFDRRRFVWPAIENPADGEFFHYELAKLGASHAHIDPKKQGRAMCEIFGAYGWTEGLRLMKWLTDHMLVRGINHFVPHAFTAKEFPDPDCPPHFYASGKNPQYRHFRLLMEYTNRICHLLNGGRHVAEAAVLYHAEAEWSGECMSAKEPMRVLMQAQLDADIVPADVLISNADVRDGRLKIGNESYGCLILPWAERLPENIVVALVSLLDRGLKIVCLNDWPVASIGAGSSGGKLESMRRHPNASLARLDDIPALLMRWGMTGVRTGTAEPYLRRYQYSHDGLTIWMFFNEEPWRTIRTSVYLEGADRVTAYDAFANRLSVMPAKREDYGMRVELVLGPDESIILLSGDLPPAPVVTRWSDAHRTMPVKFTTWNASIADAGAYPLFTPWRALESPVNLCGPGLLPDFSGTIRYDTTFTLLRQDATGRNGHGYEGFRSDAPQLAAGSFTCGVPVKGNTFLDLGEVGEVAQVWLNGTLLGTRICRPYVFDTNDALKPGENTLRVEVVNTLVCAMKDELSRFATQGPSGLIGPVQLKCLDREG